jgi:hypothetical protein
MNQLDFGVTTRIQAKAVQRYNLKLAANKESLRKYGPPEPKPRTVASPEKRAAMKRLRKLEKSLGAERVRFRSVWNAIHYDHKKIQTLSP